MIERLFLLLRDQRRAVFAAILAAAALGIVFAFRLPAAILPEVTFPRIKVIADSGERPGEEMLRAVTRPIEESLRRVPHLREMRSTTSRGSAEINLDFDWGADMARAVQQVEAQIEAVRARLPDGSSVEARIMSPAQFPVLGVSLTSDTLSLAELRDLAVIRLQPELARLPGVAQVVVQGGERLEARVTLAPAALQGRGLDAATVAAAIRRSDALESVGLLDANRELYLGLADARPADLEALAAIPIPVENGPPATLGQLGTIALATSPEYTRYAARARSAVLVNLLRQPAASTLDLAAAARRWFHDHRDALPAGVRVETFYDQSDLVRSSLDSVRDSLLVGALMAILIVVAFLRRLRPGLIAALVLPGALALTLLGFRLAGQSFNLMTLGGIAAAVGLVLDDAIVVVEHLDHRFASADRPSPARAMAEIFPAMLGSSLCTIAIFIPFIGLGGVAGAFFRVLALAMALMLATSLLLSLTVIPALGAREVAPAAAPRPNPGPGRFARAIGYATRHRWVAFLPPLALIAALLPLGAMLGTGFLPEMDEGSLILDYAAPPGTSLTETERILRQVEKEIDATPEVEAWSRRTGDQLGFFITEPNIGDYALRLRAHRRRSADEIADALRSRLEATQPALQIEFGQLVEDVIGDLTTAPQPIEARLFGEDRVVLEQRARELAGLLDHVRGVVDVKSGVVVSGPNAVLVPGPPAQRAGLGAPELAAAVEPYVRGIEAGSIPRGARAWPVRVTLAAPAGATGAGVLADMRVPVARGQWVRLGDIATLRMEPGETEIARDNQRTMVAVTARLSGRDLGSAMREIQSTVRHRLPLAPGMDVQYAGLWAEQQSSFRGLGGVLLGAAAAVLILLLAAFRSWRRALAVLVVAASSLVGVLLALFVGGATFNVSSFVGAIMIVGIVAENAYFLVAAHQAGLAAGLLPDAAAEAAARRRTRPILMTTAAGIAALLPLALGVGSGSALLKPLAIAVVGGFATSAPLLLLVLPALLARSGRATD